MPKWNRDGSWAEPETDREGYTRARNGALKWALIIGVLVAVLSVGGFALRWYTADARGSIAAREQIKANGSYRIAAYDHFFDVCAAVQTQEDRIAIFAADTSPEGQINLRAVQAKRAELIRAYNADASKSYTEGQFRSSKLPYQLDPNDKETKCTD